MTVQILIGDCRQRLAELPDNSVNCCVTSPPYFGLRDYGVDGQMGLEATPDEFVAGMVAVFREVRRALRDDGTLWLNIGDSYSSSPPGTKRPGASGASTLNGINSEQYKTTLDAGCGTKRDTSRLPGIKAKDLIGIPWMLAFALRADGWYLRQDIIWSKPNPMPESVTDRCTKAHEYLFLLSKGPRYYYDAAAIAEPVVARSWSEMDGGAQRNPDGSNANEGRNYSSSGNKARKPGTARGCPEGTGSNVCGSIPWEGSTRNKRSVWEIPTQPFAEAHFATFPPALIEPCILAGCPREGMVLDPFGGAGTTGLVADRLQRNATLIELNPEYAAIAQRRLDSERGGLLDAMEAGIGEGRDDGISPTQ